MATYHEKGRYKARIINSIINESRGEKKTPQFELSLKLLDQEDGDSWEPYLAEDRYPPVIFLSITDGTMGDKNNPRWVTRLLQEMGFDFSKFDPDSLMGWEGIVECRHEKRYGGAQGDLIEKWSIWQERQASSRGSEPRTDLQKQLKAKYAKMFKSNGKSEPATVPAEANHATSSSQNTDDIPF